VDIVDPSPAVARQVGRVIAGLRNDEAHSGALTFFTSGDPVAFRHLAARLLGEPLLPEQVHAVRWQGGEVVVPAR